MTVEQYALNLNIEPEKLLNIIKNFNINITKISDILDSNLISLLDNFFASNDYLGDLFFEDSNGTINNFSSIGSTSVNAGNYSVSKNIKQSLTKNIIQTHSNYSKSPSDNTSKNDSNITSKNDSNITSKNDSNITSKNDSNITSKNDSNITSKNDSNITSKNDSNITSKNDSNITSKNDSNITSKNDSNITSKNDSNITSKNDSNITSKNDSNITSKNDEIQTDYYANHVCGINIDSVTFTKAYNCLKEANNLIENGLGNFNELNIDVLSLVNKKNIQNTDRLNFFSHECLTLKTNMYNTIKILAQIDEDAATYFDNIINSDSINEFGNYHNNVEENDEIEEMLSSVLEGKNFSILGDSISTYKGYSNNNTDTNSTIEDNLFHYQDNKATGIETVNDVWWMQVANQTGMNILVNNSYSGDEVTNMVKTRAAQLHDDIGDNSGTNPDIIAVYMGINDIKNDVSVEDFTGSYNDMISTIKTNYPDSDVFVFTHVPYYYSSAANPTIDDATLEQYNDVIRSIADTNNCTVVDLYANSGINSENFTDYTWRESNGKQGLHPNGEGMDAISETFINALGKKYLKQ